MENEQNRPPAILSGEKGENASDLRGGESQEGGRSENREQISGTKAQIKSIQDEISEDEIIKFVEESVNAGIQSGFFCVNGYKIKKLYPKSFKLLFEHLNKRSQVGEVEEAFVIGSLGYSPRSILPEFFDATKIFINFVYIELGPTNWKYTITIPGVGAEVSELYESRVLAEAAVYEAAFKKLEDKLT